MIRHSIPLLLLLVLACVRIDREKKTAPDTATVVTSVRPVDIGAPRLPPVDQADASFRAFRTKLLTALSQHDTTFLYSILAPEIKNSFGGDDSIAGFKRIWNMDSASTPVWTALSRVLQMGGKLADSTFVAPYVYAFWPDSIDAFKYVAVTNNAAPVHATPDGASPVVGTASYSILKFADWKNLGAVAVATDSTWALVQLPDEKSMWLQGSEVYSPIGWRAFFEKRQGRWLMTMLVAGD